MKKKVLFVASIAAHFKAFHLPYLKWFQEQGYETHVACNDMIDLPYVDFFWEVDLNRSPFSISNYKAYVKLKKIIEKNNYSLINCHTPAASVLTRLAAKKARLEGTKVLYTAHGFHFYKGGPKLYWMLFYPIELVLSHLNDAIITINREDFNRIKTNGSSKSDYYIIPGIGVDGTRFYPLNLEQKQNLRNDLNFPLDKKIIVYAAEFIARKNHKFIIKSIYDYRDKFKDKLVLFAGKGLLEYELKKLVSHYNLNDIISFVGFRRDIDKIYQLSDLGISSSKQEGLGLNLIEEMMCGLPVVASVDRGHKEIVDNGINGFLFEQNNSEHFVKLILEALCEKNYLKLSEKAIAKAENFELSNSLNEMSKIYRIYM